MVLESEHRKINTKGSPKKGGINQAITQKKSLGARSETYQRYLRKSGWRFCESFFLWDILIELQQKFPNGFTRTDEFEYLVNRFGRRHSRSELRSAIYILYQIKAVIYKTNDILIVVFPPSERALSRRVDTLLINKIVNICKMRQLPFELESVVPLLTNSYTPSQIKNLISDAQSFGN
jgi:hypothetical protein